MDTTRLHVESFILFGRDRPSHFPFETIESVQLCHVANIARRPLLSHVQLPSARQHAFTRSQGHKVCRTCELCPGASQTRPLKAIIESNPFILHRDWKNQGGTHARLSGGCLGRGEERLVSTAFTLGPDGQEWLLLEQPGRGLRAWLSQK